MFREERSSFSLRLPEEDRIATLASMADRVEELLKAVDRARKRQEKARENYEQTRDELVAALRKAYAAGASYRVLAARLGVYHGEVQRLLREAGKGKR